MGRVGSWIQRTKCLVILQRVFVYHSGARTGIKEGRLALPFPADRERGPMGTVESQFLFSATYLCQPAGRKNSFQTDLTHGEMGPRPWHRFLMMLQVWCVTEIFGGHMPVFYGHFYKETYLAVELSLTWRSLVQKGCEALRVKKVEQRIFPTVWTSGPVILFIDSHSPWGLGTELELRTNMEDKLEEAQGLARAPTFYVSLCKLPWTPG